MPSPAPEFARKAIGVSMANDHAALESLRHALLNVPGMGAFAEATRPLFVSASFCVDPIAATPYVPIPLELDTSPAIVRIAPGRPGTLDRYQRSLLNVSRSMQLADDPIQGVLSWAHIEGRHWYTGLKEPDPRKVKSVAKAEAQAIGAREMMFIPLPRLSSQSGLGKADVVIIFWWKNPPATTLPVETIVSNIQTSSEILRWGAGELRRLREGDATRYQLLIYLRHIEQFLKGRGPRAIQAWNDISHNTGPYLTDDVLRPAPLTQWLRQSLSLRTNPMNAVPGISTETVLHLRTFDGFEKRLPIASLTRTIVPDWRRVLVRDAEFAQKLVDEALSSIGAHDCQLLGVDVELTKQFCHIAFRVSRGRPLDLDEYFAIRRGLFVPSTEGLGIGLALFSRRASMRGAFRALYVSPNGVDWRIDVAVPVSHQESKP